MNHVSFKRPSVFITGASGYIGRQLVETLARNKEEYGNIVASDIRETPPKQRFSGIDYVAQDVRSPEIAETFNQAGINIVVHLATIVTPGKNPDREFEYSVDVLGTENVLEACLKAGVRKLIITSSGAAYGYHSDNPEWLDEMDALRGNKEFTYSHHKRLVEEMLTRYRDKHPELGQLIFRPGVILGDSADNQITALFDKKIMLGISGSATPFVFIWDQDVVACIVKGIREEVSGIYNLAGDGALTMKDIASIINKPYLPLPASLVRTALLLLKFFRLTQYGPEQVRFLQYRPVLSNRRLKEEFGYTPQKTTREVFDNYLKKKLAS